MKFPRTEKRSAETAFLTFQKLVSFICLFVLSLVLAARGYFAEHWSAHALVAAV